MNQKITMEEFCLKVGNTEEQIMSGSLYLRGTGITELPDNLTVGGSLYLSGTGITELPDNLTVGGWLDLSGTGITDTSNVKRTLAKDKRKEIYLTKNHIFTWERGNVTYIKADGVFSILESRRGNVFRVHGLHNDKLTYLVTDGEGHHAHGDTIANARESLVYKLSDRDKSEYDGLTPDSVMTYEEAVECYRVITGACEAGTRDFCENVLHERKDNYTIREISKLTIGRYGNDEFRRFFKL